MSQAFVRKHLHLHQKNIRQWIDAVANVPDAFAWIVFSAVAANTLAFIVMFSNPIIQSDAWYFLDIFVRKALDGGLQLGDFFVQRGPLDHAQPLLKLILLADLRYFHLDFRYEALAGWLAAMLSLLFMRKLVFWEPNRPERGMHVWSWAGLCVAFVSLNSINVWAWPLVAANHTSYVFLFATLVGLWRWLERKKLVLFVASAVMLDIVADDTAILANVACLFALVLSAQQNPAWRKRTMLAAVVLLSCLAVVRLGYAALFTTPEYPHMAVVERLASLWNKFLDGGWWQWMLVPLASSIVSIVPLQHFGGDHARSLQVMVGLILFSAHCWFWWRAIRTSSTTTASGFAAIVLMLLFYAFVAGIIYGRVTEYGNAYLDQPRYVLVYNFNIVALLLMRASCAPTIDTSAPSLTRSANALVVVLLIALQIPLSHLAWSTGPYVKEFQQRMAWQLGELARHPERIPEHCLPQLIVCRYPPGKRIELLHLLESHQLNVFSPQFQRATQLDPGASPK